MSALGMMAWNAAGAAAFYALACSSLVALIANRPGLIVSRSIGLTADFWALTFCAVMLGGWFA